MKSIFPPLVGFLLVAISMGRDLVALRIAPGDVHAGAEAHGIFASEVADWMDRDWFPALPVEPAAEPRSDGSAAPGPG